MSNVAFCELVLVRADGEFTLHELNLYPLGGIAYTLWLPCVRSIDVEFLYIEPFMDMVPVGGFVAIFRR
jgi:hypothetical protein